MILLWPWIPSVGKSDRAQRASLVLAPCYLDWEDTKIGGGSRAVTWKLGTGNIWKSLDSFV